MVPIIKGIFIKSHIKEGVETKAQLDFLTTLSCDGVQGYFIAKPMPLEDLFTWAKENTVTFSPWAR